MIFFERHKPIITILVAIVLMAAIGGVFYVLHQHEEVKDMENVGVVTEKTLTDFSDSIKTGDIQLAKKYCTKEGSDQLVLDSMDTNKFKKTLLEGLSVSEDELPEDSKAYLIALQDALKSKAVTDVTYDISQLEVEEKSDEGYVVSIPVTFTGVGSFNSIDFSSELSYANHSMMDFAVGNQDALMNHRDAFGDDGVRGLLRQQAYNNLFSAMATKAQAMEPTAKDYQMKLLVTKGKDGEYSSAKIVGAEEILE
jgi:hypothetical protein